MAEKTPKQVQEIGKKQAIGTPVVPSMAAMRSTYFSKPDGYDGTLNADPMFGSIDALRQMAIRQGKIS